MDRTLSINRLNLVPVLTVKMLTSNNDQLTVRIDRGIRPHISVNQEKNHAQIFIPLDNTVNHEPLTGQLSGGFTVRVQRMQQQYKISIQHQHEKKADCVIFSSQNHDRELKTTVKELNTRIPKILIAGANMEVNGVLKGNDVILESTIGTLHVYAKLTARKISLHSQNIVLATEALLSTNNFKAISRKLQIDGRVFPNEEYEAPFMKVDLNCGLVHIGIDGAVGASNDRERQKKPKTAGKQIITENLKLSVAGKLANYGKITARENIEVDIAGSLVSLSDGSLDSAGRGYNALKQLRKVNGSSVCQASSSDLKSAIEHQNASSVAFLIERGVDVNDKVGEKRSKRTVRHAAIQEYKEARAKSHLNSARESITLINALLVAHDWRRGAISANSIVATIGYNCEDTAQFCAKQLQLKVRGCATVERDSIWSSQWVEMEVGANVTFHGQSKLKSIMLTAAGAIITTEDAILSIEVFARTRCSRFDCSGMWCVGENLTIDSVGEVAFATGSYVESEKLEVESGGDVISDATWQLATCWLHSKGMLTVEGEARLFVEQSADLSCKGMHFHGFLHVVEQLDVILQDSAHFFHSSRLEAHVFKLTCQGFATIGGVIVVNDVDVYVRNDLITTSTGKVMTTEGVNATVGSFKNDSMWQVERNMKMIAGQIMQSEDGVLYVKCSLELNLHEDSTDSFNGKLIASYIIMKILKAAEFDGFIRCNEMELSLPYVDESHLILSGRCDIMAACLTVNGNISPEELSETRRDPIKPNLTLNCSLTCAAIIAPFVSVHVAEKSMVRLNGIDSRRSDEYSILINAGALATFKESSILSLADESDTPKINKSEAVICASTFFHQGQMKFSSDEVHIISPVFVHSGRLTNTPGKQNFVQRLYVNVAKLLLNHGILAADVLEVTGDGILENTNRIFASDSMDIRLSNFHNDDGLMESKNSMKLLAVTKEWTKLGGSIKARKSFDVYANRLNMALQKVDSLTVDKRISFSAKMDLMVSSDVGDESKELSVGCAAQQSVTIDSHMLVDRLEVLLGENLNDTVAFNVSTSANLIANTVFINSKAENVQVTIDGNVQCKRIRFGGKVKNVIVSGTGAFESTTVAAQTSKLSFDVNSAIRLGEVDCHSFNVINGAIMRLFPSEGDDVTTIVTEDLSVEGTLLVEKKLLARARSGAVRLTGNILGTTDSNEFTCEAHKIVSKGTLASFKFVEMCARDGVSLQHLAVKFVERFGIRCTELNMYDVDVEACRTIVLLSESITAGGTVLGGGVKSEMSLYATNVHLKLNVKDMERVTITCKRSTTIKGEWNNVRNVDVDSKWIQLKCDLQNCEEAKFTAWSIANTRQVHATRLYMTGLAAILNLSCLLAEESRLIAPFIMSMDPLSVINVRELTVHSLAFCTRNDVQCVGTNYLCMNFDPENKMGISPKEHNAFKDISTMLRDRWNQTSIEAAEVLIGLKYISDLLPLKLNVNTSTQVYEELVEFCSRFESTPISLLNYGELVLLILKTRSELPLIQDIPTHLKHTKKRADSSLYEALVPFKLGKYSKDEESDTSSDTDIGYVSRSDSEDLTSPRSSAIIEDTSALLFTDDHFERMEESVSFDTKDESTLIEAVENTYNQEDEDLAEFEELEDELAMAEEGIIRTDYIICHERRIKLARLKEKTRNFCAPRPVANFPLQRMPSSNDLVMKKLQVKSAMTNFDLRSFGSQSSLNSVDFATLPEFGAPLQFNTSSPFQKMKIPVGSFRSPRKPVSRTGTPSSIPVWNH